MSAAQQLVEARAERDARAEAHRQLETQFSDLYMEAQALKRNGKLSSALDLTGQQIKIGEQRTLAHQLLQMASARVQRAERQLLAEAKRALCRRYQQQASDIATMVAALVEADMRAGDVPQCAALSRFAVPAWAGQRSDDTGMLESYYSLDQHRADGAALLNALLVQEPSPDVVQEPVEPEPATDVEEMTDAQKVD